MSAAIECRSLLKRYGKQTAVDAIDLEIVAGECFGLLGPNGAGKTTTVEILEGLNRPDSGTVKLFGIGWRTGRDQELRERIGVQLQDTQLGDKLFVVEVFELFRSFYREGRSVDELIALLDLEAERKKHYSKLSGGQKQRVALGCALVGNPDLLFLDEPTTGLDPRARRAIWGVVERFRAGGGTVLLTTHYMEEATALCDRIAIMDLGKIIARGTPRALVDGLGLVQFVEFEVSAPLDEAALGALSVVSHVEKRRGRYRLRIDRSLGALRGVLAELERQDVVPVGLSTHQATLDDVFLQLTGRGLEADQPGDGNGNGNAASDAARIEKVAS
jgi:ABC-2 type transport system ATP-binding protein